MALRTPFCHTPGVDHPIVLGGMTGISDSRLAVADSNAGGARNSSGETCGLRKQSRRASFAALRLGHSPLSSFDIRRNRRN
jgi:NAD(P)H-dependent flavin oxidoreductase YrpB (nitropropane dioxygenase family)